MPRYHDNMINMHQSTLTSQQVCELSDKHQKALYRISELERKVEEATSLLNEAAPIMRDHYLRRSWFEKVNQLSE